VIAARSEPKWPARRGAAARAGAWLLPLAIFSALLGIWELAARLDVIANALRIEPFLVPAPSDIAQSLWNDRSLLADNGWVTLQEVLAGFALSVAAGVCFAVLLHLSSTLRRAVYPLLVASQTVPIVVVAPILVVWLGFGIGPKLAIIALICFFPITVNTLDGLGSVDPDLLKMMRTLDASRRQTLIRVEGPTALPYFFSGAKIAVAVAVIGAVFGEWAGSSSGLGHLIQEASAQLQTARTFAAVAVLSALAIALFALLAALERRVAWWGPRETRS
jgi:NitT/TauT family transport system permease protein/putative hydroxymethylpyrimidine transport system permease protein